MLCFSIEQHNSIGLTYKWPTILTVQAREVDLRQHKMSLRSHTTVSGMIPTPISSMGSKQWDTE